MHLYAKAAFAFVGDVENQQSGPEAGLIEPLFRMLLKASFVVFDGLAGPNGLFSGGRQALSTYLPGPATTSPRPLAGPWSGF